MNKKIILNLILLFSSLFVLCYCTKSEKNSIPQREQSLKDDFAVILSKAVHENYDLRLFLRDEALKEFDKDYDVFYPYVKDKLVDGSLSFREILSQFDEKGVLPKIESNCTLLNILIPDWSWIGAFSVKDWDIQDNDVSIVVYSDNKNYTIYSNGQKDGVITLGEIPGFPVLIVKDNDRLKSVSTKSGLSYSFIDEAFNGNNTKSEARGRDHEYYDRTFPTEDYSNFVLQSEVNTNSVSAISAYYIFNNNPYAAHRDYIYYGMTNEITNGKLNNRITEYITKFRFATLDTSFFFETGDFESSSKTLTRTSYDQNDYLMEKMLLDGNLEIYFDIYVGNKDNSVQKVRKFVSVPFKDAFQLSKVHVDFMHKTWFQSRKWVYTVDRSCFLPKWINVDLRLPKWDISTQSTIMNIFVSEYDNSETKEVETIIKTSYSDNFVLESEVAASAPIGNVNLTGKVKVGYNQTSGNETSDIVKNIINLGSDDLGSACLYYSDPIIESVVTGDDGKTSGYRIREINTGFVHMLIIPKYE